MAGFLSSPRRRRRLVRWGVVLAGAAGVAVVAVHWSNTGHSEDLPVSSRPATIVPREHLQPAALTGARREAARLAVATFMEEAVLRHDLADAWNLVSPSYRQGFTRDQWRRGISPVVPFRYASYKVGLSETYADRLELEVRAYARKSSGLRDQTFSLELTQAGRGDRAHWLVNYFMPKATLSPSPAPNVALGPAAKDTSALAPIWLLVPFGLLGGGLLLIAGLGVRGWYRGVRARRAYERSLAR